MIRKIIKFLLGFKLLTFLLRKKIFIFVYHDVSDIESALYSDLHSTTIQCFEDNLNYFKANFKIISIDDLNSNQKLNNGPYAIITFDDGLASVKSNAIPILRELSIPYTIFVNQSALTNNYLWNIELINNLHNIEYLTDFYNKFIDKFKLRISDFIINPIVTATQNLLESNLVLTINKHSKLYLSNSEIKSLITENTTIGDHSAFHFNLSKVAGYENLNIDYITSADYLEKEFNITPYYFAIPFGKKEHYNSKVIDYIFSKGYKFVFTTNPIGFESINYLSKTHCILPRIGLTNQSNSDINYIINRTIFKKIDI